MTTLQAITLGSLVGTLLYEYSVDIPAYKDIQDTSKVILSIASVQYIGTLSTRGSPISEQLRYLDWFLTTPLLLRMLFLYLKSKIPNRNAVIRSFYPVLIADALMIVLGYLAQYVYPQYKLILAILSFLCLLIVELWAIRAWRVISPLLLGRQRALFGMIISLIIFTWPFYGIGFFFPDTMRSNTYSVLDILNKAVFSLLFLSLIRQEVRIRAIDV